MRYVVLAHLNFELNDPNNELDETKAADYVRGQLEHRYPNGEVILVETVEVTDA